ncbi:MAG TPA: glutathione S-transferase N-terminal domain-containing protein [Xanthobacteraceae bacterium]|jgi:glutathione S-transferase|nr:glutathione S-transferase N-terminal domain-containing protein [Xanthobacteraceae bacterium]
MSIRIWGRKSSLNVQKVLWCCVELGIEFDRIDWGGTFGGNDDPDYRAMNPNGRVPTIRDGDRIVWESNTILRYLCATRDGARLLPTEPYRRSEIERWMDWQLAALNPSMTTLLLGYYRTPADKRDAAALENARKLAIVQWTIVEKWLEGRDYLADDFTLADIGNGILVHRWHSYPIERPDLPRVRAWYERLSARPGFQAHVAGPVG